MRQPCPKSSITSASPVSPIPFGLKAGRMVRVQEVATGLACGCTCPACGHPLVAKAKDSRWRRPHFAHYRDAECRAGFETAVHKGAKQLIADQMRLCLPEWDGEVEIPNPPMLVDDLGHPHYGRRVEFPPEHVRLSMAFLERPRGDYIPDVTARDSAGELLIEIRVSHAVAELKRRRVQSEGGRMLEIDLSRLTVEQALDPQAFEKTVLDTSENREWLSCPDATEAWRMSREALKVQVIKINQEIAKAKALEMTRLEESRAIRARNEQKRAKFREQLRQPLLKDLEMLPGLVSQGAVAQRLSRFEKRDGDAIAEGLGAIENQSVRTLLAHYHQEAWVYQAHPVLWQLGVYRHFIQDRKPGLQFNQRDVAIWVRDQYGIEKSLYRLFIAQYKARCRARMGGFRKQRISAWFLTEQENMAVPNIYLPVNWFVDRCVRMGILHKQSTDIGNLIRP